MNDRLRDVFDLKLEEVLAALPQRVHDLIAEVPLHVEDYPPNVVLRELGISDRGQLCGLFTGVAIGDQSVMHPPFAPNAVTIYREGIMNAAHDEAGELTERELKRQIRITILHELAHHHGIDDDELDEMGYG